MTWRSIKRWWDDLMDSIGEAIFDEPKAFYLFMGFLALLLFMAAQPRCEFRFESKPVAPSVCDPPHLPSPVTP